MQETIRVNIFNFILLSAVRVGVLLQLDVIGDLLGHHVWQKLEFYRRFLLCSNTKWELSFTAYCYFFAPIRSQQGECVSRCSNEAEIHGKSKHRQYSA